MPTISKRFVVGAGATIDNALAGSQYEFAPFDGTIEIGIFSSGSDVTCAVMSGPDILAEPGTGAPFGTAEALPVYPDHYPFEDEVAQGDRLKVTLQNANAAPRTVWTVLRLTPA